MASNMNDMPSFPNVDNNSLDTKVFSQPIPMQLSSAENTIMTDSTSMEPNTVSSLSSANTSASSLHSMLINSNSSSTTSTSIPVTPASQNHVPTTVNHIPKVHSSINHSIPINTDQVLTKTRLQDLVKEIDPCEQLDEEVEDLLLQLVDDFVNSTVNTACVFAKHRNASTVEVKDVQLYLEKMYQMWIPGFGTEEVKPYKKPPITDAHKQRLALIRKSLKKY